MDTCSTGSSTGSNFRELDVEFLQTQAKIWLEQVLDKRFDEEDTVADILADGELLFQVSMLISELVQRKFGGEPESPMPLTETPVVGKHSGKYLPYSNVDAFLKVCQKLGLTGVDLFSPPDVVEKRDIRRVCLCIRALSKKARSKHLNVPDFDVVTHTVAMPTGMVGGIRKYLEQTRYSSSSDSCHSPSPESKERLVKNIEPICTSPFELSSEMSDEAESRLRSPEAQSPGSLAAEITEVTKFTLSASPSRGPHFASENWSPLGLTACASPIQSYSPSKDIDVNESESEVIDAVTTDAVNGCLAKSEPFNSDECFANSTHAELISTSGISALLLHSAAQGAATSVDGSQHAIGLKADGTDTGCATTDLLAMMNSITQSNDLSTQVQSDAPSKDADVDESCLAKSEPSNSDECFANSTHAELISTSGISASLLHSAAQGAATSVDGIQHAIGLKADGTDTGCATTDLLAMMNLITQFNDLSTQVQSDAPSKDADVDESFSDESRVTDRVVTDAVDAYLVKSELSNSNVHFASNTHEEWIPTATVSTSMFNPTEQGATGVDVDGINVPKEGSVNVSCASVLEADSLNLVSQNMLETDRVGVDSVNALKTDIVSVDTANIVDVECANAPKVDNVKDYSNADSIDVECVDMKADGVNSYCAIALKADGVDVGPVSVPKVDSVDVDCINVMKADSVDIDHVNVLKADSVGIDCKNIPKEDSDDVDTVNMVNPYRVGFDCKNVPKLDSMDVDCTNAPKVDCVDIDCTDAPKVDCVDIDCSYVPEEDNVDIGCTNVPEADSVDIDDANIPIRDSVNSLCADVPKTDDGDIDCENVLQEDCVVDLANVLKADVVDVDIATSVWKADNVDADLVDRAVNLQKADSVTVGWEDVPKIHAAEVEHACVVEGDRVEVDWEAGSMENGHVSVPKEDRVDIDYQHMPCLMQCLNSVSKFVGLDHTLIASESTKQHDGSSTDSADVDYALIAPEAVDQHSNEREMYRETIVTEKDKSTGSFTPAKHHRKRLWMSYFAGGLALLGTVIVILRARKPEDYEIKEGDTISQISKRAGKSSWKELVQINPEIKNPDLIYPGDRLRLQ